ncbi:MAG: DUF3825 domain-containing protein [Bacteroidales bacterium]|nr:DUF3825 domain-containing protein [Bacteroidales bacterium]
MSYHSEELFKFAYFPKYDEQIEYLAEYLAALEQWDFSDTRTKEYAILKNYLEHTFRRLKKEEKISYTRDNNFACFNTGLVTRNYEDIHAFFEKNKNPETTPFCFKAFKKESDQEIISHFSENLPDRANYFDEPELLIFNPKCEIIYDIDHIIENISRFPNRLRSADEATLRREIAGAIDETKKRVKTNYKLAVPQYYQDKIQLLLPLWLTPGSPNPDLALAVEKVRSSCKYSARTCLTLKMAYNNARLIVKPETDWLQP